jgi:hypothetical protein
MRTASGAATPHGDFPEEEDEERQHDEQHGVRIEKRRKTEEGRRKYGGGFFLGLLSSGFLLPSSFFRPAVDPHSKACA